MTGPRHTPPWHAIAAALLALVLAGCASSPPPPDWKLEAKGAIDRAQQAYLSGKPLRVEAEEFARARSELARTGRAELVARAELLRCATRVASLVFEPCSGFAPLAPDAGAAERAYAAYLAGELAPRDAALLPEQHRALAAAAGDTPGGRGAVLARIEDPLSRPVAAGVLLRTGRADPSVIAVAIDAASERGWRRPLLAWLGVQLMRAEAAGDAAAAERVRRRIALVGDGA